MEFGGNTGSPTDLDETIQNNTDIKDLNAAHEFLVKFYICRMLYSQRIRGKRDETRDGIAA
jgi:hypothetical protein